MNNYGMINCKFQLCCGPLTELTHKIALVSTNLRRFLTWIATLHQQVIKLMKKEQKAPRRLGEPEQMPGHKAVQRSKQASRKRHASYDAIHPRHLFKEDPGFAFITKCELSERGCQ